MSERTINDLMNDNKETYTENDLYYDEKFDGEKEYYAEPKNEFFNKIITAETGEGSIESYLDHPMNFNNSMGLAQTLRGLTGIIGNLNLAIIDIVFGALRFSKEKRNRNDVPGGGNIPIKTSDGMY